MDGRGGGANKRVKRLKGAHARTVFVGSKRHPEGKGKEWIKRRKNRRGTVEKKRRGTASTQGENGRIVSRASHLLYNSTRDILL